MTADRSMRVVPAAIFTLATQWLLGALLYATVAWLLARLRGRRRWLATWTASARTLGRTAPYAALCLLAGAALATLLPGGIARALHGIWPHPIALLLLGAAPTAACHVMLHAGRLEARGRLRVARRRGRLAGELIFVGAQAQLVLVWAGLSLESPFRRALLADPRGAGTLLLAATVALAVASCVAVTGALAGKPRPSSYVATFFYITGIVTLITSYQATL
jgi:hypothetical protein